MSKYKATFSGRFTFIKDSSKFVNLPIFKNSFIKHILKHALHTNAASCKRKEPNCPKRLRG